MYTIPLPYYTIPLHSPTIPLSCYVPCGRPYQTKPPHKMNNTPYLRTRTLRQKCQPRNLQWINLLHRREWINLDVPFLKQNSNRYTLENTVFRRTRPNSGFYNGMNHLFTLSGKKDNFVGVCIAPGTRVNIVRHRSSKTLFRSHNKQEFFCIAYVIDPGVSTLVTLSKMKSSTATCGQKATMTNVLTAHKLSICYHVGEKETMNKRYVMRTVFQSYPMTSKTVKSPRGRQLLQADSWTKQYSS